MWRNVDFDEISVFRQRIHQDHQNPSGFRTFSEALIKLRVQLTNWNESQLLKQALAFTKRLKVKPGETFFETSLATNFYHTLDSYCETWMLLQTSFNSHPPFSPHISITMSRMWFIVFTQNNNEDICFSKSAIIVVVFWTTVWPKQLTPCPPPTQHRKNFQNKTQRRFGKDQWLLIHPI